MDSARNGGRRAGGRPDPGRFDGRRRGEFLLNESHGVYAGAGCVWPSPGDPSLVRCTGAISMVEIDVLAGDGFVDYLPSGALAGTLSVLKGGSGNDVPATIISMAGTAPTR